MSRRTVTPRAGSECFVSEGFPDFDLYEQLEVSPNASSDVIQAAYRKLARRYHPDSSVDPDPARMVKINVAFEILSSGRTAARIRHLARWPPAHKARQRRPNAETAIPPV